MAGNLARGNDLNIGQGWALKVVAFLGALFLITPLVILIVFSFNDSRTLTHWEGFSLRWYAAIFKDAGLWVSLKNSLVVAIVSTLITTVIATMGALLIGKYNFKGRALFQNLLYVPIILPEIIFGVALLALFMLINFPLGILSIICAHITFSFPFATLVILSSVVNLPPSLEEASLDLGASRWQTFKWVVLPNIMTGVVSGAMFAFTLSIDDFIVTFFTAGVGASTLPLKIYSMIKYGLTPSINAISTVLIVFTVVALYATDKLQKSKSIGKRFKIALASGFLVVVLSLIIIPMTMKDNKTVNLYNYSEYIDTDLLDKFKAETGISVNIDFYTDNEDMLSRLKMGVTGYDIVVPTGYMIKIMKEAGMLAPLDFSNIPNIKYISSNVRKLDFDTTGNYYINYVYGFTGIVYNSDKIHDPISSWGDLWNPAYKGNILMVDDMREVYYAACKKIGKPFDDNPETLKEAFSQLVAQKPLVMKYESNATEEMMKSGDAWIAQTWNGVIQKVCESDPKFKLCVPREGLLFFFDNLAVLSTSPNKKNAELFINFMLRPENSAANMKKIRYAMPNEAARALLDSSLRFNPVVFPVLPESSKIEIIRDWGDFNKVLDKAWTELKVR